MECLVDDAVAKVTIYVITCSWFKGQQTHCFLTVMSLGEMHSEIVDTWMCLVSGIAVAVNHRMTLVNQV